MSNRHEPRDAFVSDLEDRLRAELTRQRVAAPAPRWIPQSRRGLALATAAVVLISMAIGGGVVAAAYEAEQNELRDMLVGTYRQRLDLAAQRLDLAQKQLKEVEGRVATGIEVPAAARDARLKVTEAEAEQRVTQIDLDEVRATGREPMKIVSAPLVSGRDLVSDRWRLEMSVKAAALEAAKLDVEAAQTRFDVGLANADDVEAAGVKRIDLESALQLAQQKIAIRQTFVGGRITAAVADLRVLEAETEQRRAAAARRIDFSRRQLQIIRTRVEIGTVNPVDVAQAELRLLELELALKKAEYDLALIRLRIGK
jgi:hypothetical protein